jgi:hypothetical protein
VVATICGKALRDTDGATAARFSLTAEGQALRPLLEALDDWSVLQAAERKSEVRSTAA